MEAFLISFGIIFVAELGDKSQLMALAFAARYRAVTILLAITAATALVHLVSVLLGAAVGVALPTRAISVVAGLAFLGFAAWTLRGDELGDDDEARARQTNRSVFFTVGVPFTFGDPLLLTLALFSGAGTIGVCDDFTGCPDTEGTDPFTASGVGASSADFFHTLLLSGLVPSVGGIPVADPLFTAASGAHYTVDGVVSVVPEPGTLVLLGSGMALLFVRRRNKRAPTA